LGRPRLRVLGELAHAGRQIAGNDMLQLDFLEDRALVSPQRDPDRLQRLSSAGVAQVLRALAAHAEQWSIDGPDDVSQRNLAGRPGQPEPTFRASLATDQPGAAELRQDCLKELAR